MRKNNQPDLFGDASQQGNLFGDDAPKPQVYVPNPQHVRNRLEHFIKVLREAESMPWDSTTGKLYRDIVLPQLVELLPGGEGEQYALQFETEWQRLLAA